MKETALLNILKDLRKNMNVNTFSAGLVAAIFGCTGPALIIIGGASSGGLTYEETISWIFAIYYFSGLLGIFLSLQYNIANPSWVPIRLLEQYWLSGL